MAKKTKLKLPEKVYVQIAGSVLGRDNEEWLQYAPDTGGLMSEKEVGVYELVDIRKVVVELK